MFKKTIIYFFEILKFSQFKKNKFLITRIYEKQLLISKNFSFEYI